MATPSSINDRRLQPDVFPMPIFRPRCPKCSETFAKPPLQWNCPNCKGDKIKTWQPYESATNCTVCGLEVATLNRRHCHRHGGVVCGECGQYEMFLPIRGQVNEKERVCKGCAFPSPPATMKGILTKISRDRSTGKETGRNPRFFEIRRNILMYASDKKSVWKNFYNLDSCKVADDVHEPGLGFTIVMNTPECSSMMSNAASASSASDSSNNTLHLLANEVQEKESWVRAIKEASNFAVLNAFQQDQNEMLQQEVFQPESCIGDIAHDSTDVDGQAGFLNFVDGQFVNRYYFRLQGTELKMSHSKETTNDPFDCILLHGGTKVSEDPQDARALLISGPRLQTPLKLVGKDESNKKQWKRNIFAAMKGGFKTLDEQKKQAEQEKLRELEKQVLPEVSLKTNSCEITEQRRGSATYRSELDLREHILSFTSFANTEMTLQPQPIFLDLRGATVGVDPNRARIVTVSAAKHLVLDEVGNQNQPAHLQNLIPLSAEQKQSALINNDKSVYSLRFDDDREFKYWKACLQAVASGKAMPIRQFIDQTPEIEGFLIKVGAPKGVSGNQAQNKRHFRLYDHFLQYAEYEIKKTPEPKAEFDLYEAEISDSSSHQNGIFINGPKMKRPLVLLAESPEDKERWKSALTSASQRVKSVSAKPTMLPQRPQQQRPNETVLVNRPKRKGIGLKYGQDFKISIEVVIELSEERQQADPFLAEAWHGKSVSLGTLDAVSATLESVVKLVESVLFPDDGNNSNKYQQGMLFVPGRYIAFRQLNFDMEDGKCGNTSSVVVEDLKEYRGDDDAATMLHRLPDATFLDEIPLRSGDKLIWRDVVTSDSSSYLHYLTQQHDRSRGGDISSPYGIMNNNNSPRNVNTSNARPSPASLRSDRSRKIISEEDQLQERLEHQQRMQEQQRSYAPALSVEEYRYRQAIQQQQQQEPRSQQKYISPNRRRSTNEGPMVRPVSPHTLHTPNSPPRSVSPLRHAGASPANRNLFHLHNQSQQQQFHNYENNIESYNGSPGTPPRGGVEQGIRSPVRVHHYQQQQEQGHHQHASFSSPPPPPPPAPASSASSAWVMSAYPMQRNPYFYQTNEPSTADILAGNISHMSSAGGRGY